MVYWLCGKRVGRGAKRFLLKWGGSVSEVRLQWAGGAAWSDPASVGVVRSHHRSHGEFSGCGGWEQEKARILRDGMDRTRPKANVQAVRHGTDSDSEDKGVTKSPSRWFFGQCVSHDLSPPPSPSLTHR
jgi:hypothetical protein